MSSPENNQNRNTNNKSTQNKQRKNRKNRKHDWSFYAIIISVIILLIPILAIGIPSLTSLASSKRPLFGNRFDGQLVNKITESDLENLKANLDKIEESETIDINLSAATLRVYSKTALEKDLYEALAKTIFDEIAAVLPVENYFTSHQNQHAYDIEIHVHNEIPEKGADKENFVYMIADKTGLKEDLSLQFVTDAQSEEFVAELWEIQTKRDEKKEQDKLDKENPDQEVVPEQGEEVAPEEEPTE